LPRLGLPGAWLGIYEEATAAPTHVRVILNYDADRAGGGVPGAPPEPVPETRVAARELLRTATATLARRSSIVVEPLFFHARALGYLLLEMGPREGIVYESLAEQVSSALEGARLVTLLVEEATRRQQAERERLTKEMEIAARIQSSILPRDVTVSGLEVAASMQ